VEKQSTELPISRLFEKGFHRLIHADRILVILDLLEEAHRSWVDEKRIESGIRSLLVLPLSYQGSIIGAMDLGSPTPNDIGPVDAWLAEDIMPLFPVFSELGEPVIQAVDAYNKAVNPSIGTA